MFKKKVFGIKYITKRLFIYYYLNYKCFYCLPIHYTLFGGNGYGVHHFNLYDKIIDI